MLSSFHCTAVKKDHAGTFLPALREPQRVVPNTYGATLLGDELKKMTTVERRHKP